MKPVNNIAAELEQARARLRAARSGVDMAEREAARAEVQRLVDMQAAEQTKAQKSGQTGQTSSLGFLTLPDRLPFSGLPGYLIDYRGEPYRVKAERRKEGRVKLERRKRKGKHIVRYRLSINGKQKDFTIKCLLRARETAEEEFRNARQAGETVK